MRVYRFPGTTTVQRTAGDAHHSCRRRQVRFRKQNASQEIRKSSNPPKRAPVVLIFLIIYFHFVIVAAETESDRGEETCEIRTQHQWRRRR